MIRHKQYPTLTSVTRRFRAQRGNLGKAHELFGERLQPIIAEMNRVLTA